MMDPYLTPHELEATLGQIRQEMTTGWQTVEELGRRHTPARRSRARAVLPDRRALPRWSRRSTKASRARSRPRFRERGGGVRVPIARAVRHAGSAATWTAIRTSRRRASAQTLARQRSLVLDLYYRECAGARGALEPRREPRRRVRGARAAHASSTRGTSPKPRRRCRRATGRCRIARILRLVAARLKATYDDACVPVRVAERARRRPRAHRPTACARTRAATPGCSRCAACCAACGRSGSTWRRVDIRQNALVHRRVIGEALQEPRLARRRRRAARAPARGGARAARVAARRAVVGGAPHARGLSDDRALPAQVRPRRRSARTS